MAAPPPAAAGKVANTAAAAPAASSPTAPKVFDLDEDDEEGPPTPPSAARSVPSTDISRATRRLLDARRHLKHCVKQLIRQETKVAEATSAVDDIAAKVRVIIPPAPDLCGLDGEARLSRNVEHLESMMENVTTMNEAALRSQAASAKVQVVKELKILDEMKTQFEDAVKTRGTLLLKEFKKRNEDFAPAFSRLTNALQSAEAAATASMAELDTVKVRGGKEIEDTVATLTPFL